MARRRERPAGRGDKLFGAVREGMFHILYTVIPYAIIVMAIDRLYGWDRVLRLVRIVTRTITTDMLWVAAGVLAVGFLTAGRALKLAVPIGIAIMITIKMAEHYTWAPYAGGFLVFYALIVGVMNRF